MGIHDREYYRSEQGGFLRALQTGAVIKWLIWLNVGVFVLQLLTGGRGEHMDPITELFILDTHKVLHGQIWRLLTYGFLHAPFEIMHIVMNMLFLWWFGSELEALYGGREVCWFYLISALLGGLAFTGVYLAQTNIDALRGLNLRPGQLCLGASGAITAILVLFACHFPQRTILLFFVLPVPIWAFVLLSVAMDLFYFVNPAMPTQTAVSVHLAGALFGFLYYQQGWRIAGWFGGLSRKRFESRPQLRIFRGSDEEAPEPEDSVPSRHDIDEQLEAKLDAILEKVARTGQGSLTEHERQILLRASEIYRKRRT